MVKFRCRRSLTNKPVLTNYSRNQKNFAGPMFHTKFDEKSQNFKFIVSPAKLHRSKNRQGRGHIVPPSPHPPSHPPGKLGLIVISFLSQIALQSAINLASFICGKEISIMAESIIKPRNSIV